MYRRGWLPEINDHRDLTVKKDVPKLLSGPSKRTVDLRDTGHFSPIEDQGNLGACTAHAVVGVVEYVQNARRGQFTDISRLFLYRIGRKLFFRISDSSLIGDTGCSNRDTFKALMSFGSPPEWSWPYDIRNFDKEPPAYIYSLAKEFKGLFYVAPQSLDEIKGCIDHGFPVIIGFTTYPSIDGVGSSGNIPIPSRNEKPDGGHAVVGCGYADGRGLLIRNSWGPMWGDQGYGWLPDWYFDNNMADDFWVLLDSDFMEV